MYDSSIRLWFEGFTSIMTCYTSQDACWQVKDGVALCSGKRQDSPCLIISTLVVLIIEAPKDSDTKLSSKFKDLPPWDFPLTLTPSTITKSKAKQKGITYNIIGLGFFSRASKHFIIWYADKESSQIYTYYSMKNDWNAIPDPEPTDTELPTHITSQVQANIPLTYAPSLAIYHLCGGADAQEAFYQTQTKACSKQYNLQFLTSRLSTLPNVMYCRKECPIELNHGPHQKPKGLKEYVSKKQLESKRPKPSGSKACTDNNSVSSEASPPLQIVDGPESEAKTFLPRPHRKPALKIDTKTDFVR